MVVYLKCQLLEGIVGRSKSQVSPGQNMRHNCKINKSKNKKGEGTQFKWLKRLPSKLSPEFTHTEKVTLMEIK
jgi:hypothetical protein